MPVKPLLHLAGLALALVACTASPTLTPTAAPVTVTVTVKPASPTPEPSPTTAPPTATATATATPVSTATPTATPTPVLNPLTGLPVEDPAVLERRPLAIKVAHFPRGVREYQAGLSLADNVWEHYAEGGTTRFTAIYLSQTPERIGNVRSARLIDVHLSHAYQAMLVASGSSTGTMNRLRESGLFERIIAEATGYDGCPVLCREASASVTTDKLFTSAEALWDVTTELGLNGPQALEGYAFAEQPPAGGTSAPEIHIDFHVNNTVAEWRYDSTAGHYARWIDTASMPELAPHVDTLNGEALRASTVVMLFAPYIPANIREAEGGKLHYSYDIRLHGSGLALVFRDGQMYEAAWEREAEDSGLPRVADAQGNVIPFRPGQVWFEVVDPDSPTRFEDGQFYVRVKVPPPSAAATAAP